MAVLSMTWDQAAIPIGEKLSADVNASEPN